MLSLWCQVASGHFSTRGQFSLQPNCISNFNTLRSVFTPLFSNYLISTELWISGYIGSNAFRLIPVLHHLQIWLLPCLFKSIRSLIKEEKKTNRLTLVLQCPPPLIPPAPFRSRHSHLSLANVYIAGANLCVWTGLISKCLSICLMS